MKSNYSNSEINQKIFLLTKDLFQSAFSVDTAYLKYPYQDLSKIDHGIREMMWKGFKSDEQSMPFENLEEMVFHHILLKSNLGFYNVIFFLPNENCAKPDLLSLGPFREGSTSPRYFEEIMKNAHIPAEFLRQAEGVFRQLPMLKPQTACDVGRRLLSEYYPDFLAHEARLIEFSAETHEEEVDSEQLEAAAILLAEDYQREMSDYMNAIRSGDTKLARDVVYRTSTGLIAREERGLPWQKQNVYLLNDLAYFSLSTTTVHPLHSLQLYQKMQMKIAECSDAMLLSYIPYDISHKYCLLVKNYANENCSAIVRQVMDYVAFHLEEDLSLAAIAEQFHRNASTLSHRFREETGSTLTDYVTQARIREAIRLFNSTDASVSDIALQVGFSDFAYFSRVFKKQTGLSPREYRKQAGQ